MDENNEIAPYLAESWTISPDGKTYTFNLAKNAKFHDGNPVTSEDLAFSIEVVLKHHRFGKQMFGPITGYEFPDKNTLVVNLSKAHGPLLLAATTPRQLPVMPKHVYGNSDDFMKQEAHSNPVGSGPFVISDRKTDEYVSIARNENHFVDESHQLIFKKITELLDKNILVSPITLKNYLNNTRHIFSQDCVALYFAVFHCIYLV